VGAGTSREGGEVGDGAIMTTPDDEVKVEWQPDDRFVVSRAGNNGASYARVFYTRAQLEQLIERAQEALKK